MQCAVKLADDKRIIVSCNNYEIIAVRSSDKLAVLYSENNNILGGVEIQGSNDPRNVGWMCSQLGQYNGLIWPRNPILEATLEDACKLLESKAKELWVSKPWYSKLIGGTNGLG